MDKLIPLNKKIVVEPQKKTEKTQGGIIIPETANQKTPTRGTIIAIAVDSGFLNENMPLGTRPTPLEVGDEVLFSKYAGAEMTIKNAAGEDQFVLIIKEEDLLAVIKKEKKE